MLPSNSSQSQDVICPHCGQKNQLLLTTIIDIAESPELAFFIKNDILNKFECENCQYTCELYYDFILLNSDKKYILLFSKNKKYLKSWIEMFIKEEFKADYNESLYYRKNPIGVSEWIILKEKIKNNENIIIRKYKQIFEALVKKDPVKLYEYILENKFLLDHSELAFYFNKLSIKYNLQEILIKNIFYEISVVDTNLSPKDRLIKLLKIIGENSKKSEETIESFTDTGEKIFNENNPIIIDNNKNPLNLVLRSDKITTNDQKDEDKNKMLEYLKYNFFVKPGRIYEDQVELCAVNDKAHLERLTEIEDFFRVNIHKEAYFFIEYMFKDISDSNFDLYSGKYFSKEDVKSLINEFEEFEMALNYYPTFEKFYSVCKNIYGENEAVMIAEKYSEVWEELRDGIQRVCFQVNYFFYLCDKNNKSVWMHRL